jgi:hypothetical protein
MKERAHRTSDDLGIPEVNGARHRDDRAGMQGCGGTEDGANVTGILHGIEDDEAGSFGKSQIGQAGIGNLADGEHALRGFSFSCTGELAFVDLGDVGTAPTNVSEER